MKNLISFILVIIIIALTIYALTKKPQTTTNVEQTILSDKLPEQITQTPDVENSNNLEQTKMEIDINKNYLV